MIPRVLVIAGSDSGGGAGIQADIKTVMALGGYATTAITAITAQNTLGVRAVMPVPAEMVIAQIDAVVADIGVDAVKIGMIGSAEVAEAVAERLERLPGVPIVFDPVMIATSGAVLAEAATVAAFGRLMRIAILVTPNADELSALTGRSLASEFDIADAAGDLIEQFGCAVLATGQRLPGGEIRYSDGRVVPTDRLLFDMLYGGRGTDWYEVLFDAERIDTIHDHGTGCTLASGIATGLGMGLALPEAIARARSFVRAALGGAPGFGAGHGPMGHGLGRSWFEWRCEAP